MLIMMIIFRLWVVSAKSGQESERPLLILYRFIVIIIIIVIIAIVILFRLMKRMRTKMIMMMFCLSSTGNQENCSGLSGSTESNLMISGVEPRG